MKTVGGNVPGQQQVLSALKTDNYLPVQGERERKRKPGWMATDKECREGSTPEKPSFYSVQGGLA